MLRASFLPLTDPFEIYNNHRKLSLYNFVFVYYTKNTCGCQTRGIQSQIPISSSSTRVYSTYYELLILLNYLQYYCFGLLNAHSKEVHKWATPPVSLKVYNQ